MLSFFRTRNAKNGQHTEEQSPFADDDVQRLFAILTLDPTPDHKQKLVESTADDGFVQSDEITHVIQQRISSEDARVDIESLTRSLGVQRAAIDVILREADMLFNAKGTQILTKTEQQRLAANLEKQAERSFVDLDNYCHEEDISATTLAALHDQGGVKLLVDVGHLYTTPQRLEQIRTSTLDVIKQAETGKETHTWKKNESFGLPTQVLASFVQSVLDTSSSSGSLKTDQDAVTFIPQSFLEITNLQKIEDLYNGKVPFLTVNECSKTSAIDVKNDLVYSIEGYLVSRRYIEQVTSEAIGNAMSHGISNLQDALVAIPTEVRSQVISTIHAQPDTSSTIIDNYIVVPAWLGKQQESVCNASADLAREVWLDESFSKLKGSILKSRLQVQASQVLQLEASVFESLWKYPESRLAEQATKAFSDTLSVLETECESNFVEFWKSRVMQKHNLYVRGLEGVKDEQHKQQLADLLRLYLNSDLVPAAIARAKSKGLTKCSLLKQGARLSKLQSQLTGAEDLAAVIVALQSFEAQVGLGQDFGGTQIAAKQTLLQEMLKTMRKDQDAPRLYLSLVIIVVASRRSGVVYATGKFAPKLLRQVRNDLDSSLAERLEQLKDDVKAGKITDVERDEMRSMAIDMVQTLNSP